MVSELQFLAVAVFLIWGLAASLCGLLNQDVDDPDATDWSVVSRREQDAARPSDAKPVKSANYRIN
jgi:hypothetical protein